MNNLPVSLNPEEFERLWPQAIGPHVSIYLPTHEKGTATRQDPIRFRNLMKEARRELQDHFELSAAESDSLLSEATSVEQMDENSEFWRHQQKGLAIFARPDFLQSFALPRPCAEMVRVGTRFHVTPLLPSLQGCDPFYILMSTLEESHLYKATRDSLEQVDGPDRPLTLPEPSLFIRDTSRVNLHSFRPRQPGVEATGMYHGHEQSDLEEKVLQYLRAVDRAVVGFLNDPETPLIFAGTDALFPLYREINSHRNMLSSCVRGNPAGFTPEELRDEAWKLLRPIAQERRERRIETYQRALALNKATGDFELILQKAQAGLIDTLLVEQGCELWGSWDSEAYTLELHDERQADSEDLVNLATIQTLETGGAILAMPRSDLPCHDIMGAILRDFVNESASVPT